MISAEQLDAALVKQKESDKTLGAILVEMGFLTEDTLFHFLAIQHGLEYVDVSEVTVDEELLKICSEEKARRLQICPLERKENKVRIVCCNPENPALLNLHYELVVEASIDFDVCVCKESDLSNLLDRHYKEHKGASEEVGPSGPTLEETLREIDDSEGEDLDIEIMETRKIGEDDDDDEASVRGADEAPVIRLCNYLLDDAISKGASDIHLNPYEKKIILRYRIDGALIEFPGPPFKFKKALASRYKIIAHLDPMERRRAQDGRIKYRFQGRTIELRVAILPSIWGENIVMRILDQARLKLDVNDQNFTPEQLKAFKKAYESPYGMIVVTGSTGCGKTTTLYSILADINDPEANIMTAEDPVEYRLPHIIQCQVDPKGGRSFAAVLRSFLRQDPDVIMVGEIRDAETGTIAIKASLTGHLVLTTTHTNDAPSTISRLVDMGIDPMYVGTSLLVVCSQCLIRRVCEHCKQPWKPEPELLKRANLTTADLEGATPYKGAGCDECHQTGYKGRMAVHEVLPVDSKVRDVIFKRGNILELQRVAKEVGMKSMREIALLNWRQGDTTLEEVLGKTMET